jgi:hypothetical protein
MGDLTDEEKQKLEEMIDTWDNVHRAIKFLNAIGTAIKWLIGIGASVAIIYSSLHGK